MPLVGGDATRLASIMDVMLENACIYSNAGGTVEVLLQEKNKNIVFSVSDSGIGIKSEDQKHIFTRFFRTYAAKVADTEGMGLGLAMAKSIIERHRGEIGVRSAGDGKGSTFWFSIPL
jgi:two-component system sensor histidine kinase SaeS